MDKFYLTLTKQKTVFHIRNNILSTFEEFSGQQILWKRYWSRGVPETPANIQDEELCIYSLLEVVKYC